MKNYSDNHKDNKSNAVANNFPIQEAGMIPSAFQFEDNRPEAIMQRKFKEMSKNVNQGIQPKGTSEMSVGNGGKSTQPPGIGSIIQKVNYKNTNTDKTYSIKIGGGIIEASEINNGKSNGYIKYQIDKKEFTAFLLHIESHPENGSGLGALLTFLFTMEVAKEAIPFILVCAPATTALGFYSKMGFNVEVEQEKIRKKYKEAGREKDIVEPITISEASGLTTIVGMSSSQSFFKNWTQVN